MLRTNEIPQGNCRDWISSSEWSSTNDTNSMLTLGIAKLLRIKSGCEKFKEESNATGSARQLDDGTRIRVTQVEDLRRLPINYNQHAAVEEDPDHFRYDCFARGIEPSAEEVAGWLEHMADSETSLRNQSGRNKPTTGSVSCLPFSCGTVRIVAELALARKHLVQSGLLSSSDPVILALQSKLENIVGEVASDSNPFPVSDESFRKLACCAQKDGYCEVSRRRMMSSVAQMLQVWKKENPQATVRLDVLQDCTITEIRPLCDSVKSIMRHLLPNIHQDFRETNSIKDLHDCLLAIIQQNKERWLSLMKEIKVHCS